jgi:hypothetical protein
MSAYTIYLDKEENFQCEVSIKNASTKNSSARLIIESNDVNLVFFGTVNKNTINVPIKGLKNHFNENDTAKIKLEVIVENMLVTPWESQLNFDTYNKVEIKEIKNTQTTPLVEVKIEDSKTNPKQELLDSINEQLKSIKDDVKLSKQDKKQLIKKLLSNSL